MFPEDLHVARWHILLFCFHYFACDNVIFIEIFRLDTIKPRQKSLSYSFRMQMIAIVVRKVVRKVVREVVRQTTERIFQQFNVNLVTVFNVVMREPKDNINNENDDSKNHQSNHQVTIKNASSTMNYIACSRWKISNDKPK